MKVSIVTITFDRDLEYLKYHLKSIEKFCQGYHENIVVIDDHANDCVQTQRYLESIGQKYFINREAKKIKHGYIRQQYMGYYMDKYLDQETDYVCCADTDNIFTGHHDPSVYFYNNKPVMLMQKWSDMPNLVFQDSTNSALGFDVNYNFMRRMPLVYPLSIFKKIRSFLELQHNCTIQEYFKNIELCAEYCIWGAYANKFLTDEFHWVDAIDHQDEYFFFKNIVPCQQYSSKSNNPRYLSIEKFKKIIACK